MTRRQTTNAFTLVELLTVLAVLSILASLLLPALSRGLAAARRVGCVSVQKQWALAFLSYTDDHDGWLPREGWHRNGETYWNNWAHVQESLAGDVWYNALTSFVNRPAASSYARSERKRFYKSAAFFHCPAARWPNEPLPSTYALFSIAMNSQLIEFPLNIPVIPLTRIEQHSSTVLLVDNLLQNELPVTPKQARDNLGQPASYANRFAGRRHRNSGNIAFLDGHVEARRGEHVVATEGPRAGWNTDLLKWNPK